MDIKYFYHENYDSIVIYLHGGPFFKIDNLDSDPYVKAMYKNGFSVAVLNYNTVSGDGGIVDYMTILKEIKTRFEDSSLKAIVGDSYGGYLAALISHDVMCETVVISGFISLEYQRLFSTESNWLLMYMDKNAPNYVSHTGKNSKKIVFIQGTNDQQCPYQQFLTLKASNEKVILMEGYKHRETGFKLYHVIESLITELNNEA